MKTILLALALLLAPSCAAYRAHPVATVASVATMSLGAGGICVALGDCGGDNGNSWQNDFAHYGGGQISVIAVIVASGVLAWADPNDRWPDDSLPCPSGKATHDCTAPDGHVWSRADWNRDGRWMTTDEWREAR